jgi:hypothetical protein
MRLARPLTPAVHPTPIRCLSIHRAASRRLPHAPYTRSTPPTQRTACAQHMHSTHAPVLTHRRGGVPGGAGQQVAPLPPAPSAPPGRPESGRLRRSVSPLLGGGGGGGSGSGTTFASAGVPSPMQRRGQPPPPPPAPRGSSSLPPSRPASSTAGRDQLVDYAFAHAHDALDEFKRASAVDTSGPGLLRPWLAPAVACPSLGLPWPWLAAP